MMRYEIVPMDRSHLESIAALERQCFSAPWSIPMLEEELFNPQASFLVAEGENGQVLGYAGLQGCANCACSTTGSPRTEWRGIPIWIANSFVLTNTDGFTATYLSSS